MMSQDGMFYPWSKWSEIRMAVALELSITLPSPACLPACDQKLLLSSHYSGHILYRKDEVSLSYALSERAGNKCTASAVVELCRNYQEQKTSQ